MRGYLLIYLLLFLSTTLSAQHLELSENKGEAGFMFGLTSLNGDLAPDKQFFTKSAGAFYKKQLNDYVGIKLNYTQFTLFADDGLSSNAYAKERGLGFARKYNEISILSELYFNRFITHKKNYRFSPYFGFGFGYLLDTATPVIKDRMVVPVNFGFKYNIVDHFTVFAEYMHRFTFSDNLDYLSDGMTHLVGKNNFQGSRAGNDEYFSIHVGISYNLRKIYGMEPDYRPKKAKPLRSAKSLKSDRDKPIKFAPKPTSSNNSKGFGFSLPSFFKRN